MLSSRLKGRGFPSGIETPENDQAARAPLRLKGRGFPSGIETESSPSTPSRCFGLKGRGFPSGIETILERVSKRGDWQSLKGRGFPSGIETVLPATLLTKGVKSERARLPVWD